MESMCARVQLFSRWSSYKAKQILYNISFISMSSIQDYKNRLCIFHCNKSNKKVAWAQ